MFSLIDAFILVTSSLSLFCAPVTTSLWRVHFCDEFTVWRVHL